MPPLHASGSIHACKQAGSCVSLQVQICKFSSAVAVSDLSQAGIPRPTSSSHAHLLQTEVAQVQHARELAEHEGLGGGVRSSHVAQLLAQRLRTGACDAAE